MEARDIKHIRQGLKLTQQEFADKLKVHRTTVADWERKVSRPSNLAKRAIERLLKKNGTGAGTQETQN